MDQIGALNEAMDCIEAHPDGELELARPARIAGVRRAALRGCSA